MIEARLATLEEIPGLLERIKESGGVFVDLYRTPCWVAVDDGDIVGLLAATPVFQLEPLLIFPDFKSKALRRRACYSLYRAAAQWLASDNGSNVRWAFAVTRSRAVLGWAKKMGWFQQYKGAKMFIKKF
jgi:hypothetical protein